MILDVETREEAPARIDAGPATRAGLRGEISIRYWNWAVLNRAELAQSGIREEATGHRPEHG